MLKSNVREEGVTPIQPMMAYILVGPTAVGKSEVAHLLASENGLPIISADSMAVYRGMDIGTAKPKGDVLKKVAYRGLNLVDPQNDFSVAAYLKEIKKGFTAEYGGGDSVMVVGGTGLYVRCLLEGLDELPSTQPEVREKADRLMREKGIQALQAWCRELAPNEYAGLTDPQNPRRLIRLLECATQGLPYATARVRPRSLASMVGLRVDSKLLKELIYVRVQAMYESGLVDEARDLRQRVGRLSETAEKAIGYAEAYAVLDGRMTITDAVERTFVRTRQYAKRQMTWFRNQGKVHWVDIDGSEDRAFVANRVRELWEIHGPAQLAI